MTQQVDATLSGSKATANGSSNNDLVVGTAGDDNLYGAKGDDVLMGGAGRDYMDGGDGDDLLAGGRGDDTYMFSGGRDVIVDTGGSNDTLYLRGSAQFSDLAFTRDGSNLLITDTRLNTSVTVVDHFGAGTVEKLRLADGSMLDMRTGFQSGVAAAPAGTLIEGTAARDNLSGGAGADTIYGGDERDNLFGGAGDDLLKGEKGGDYMDGGAGNDLLVGGEGDDVYLLSAGADTISDSSGSDTIRLRPAVQLQDLSFSAQGQDLVIDDAHFGSHLVVKDHFGAGTVETLQYDGGSIDLRTVLSSSTDAPAPVGAAKPPLASAPATAGFQVRSTDHSWGGVDPDHYRGAGFDTHDLVAGDNPNQGKIVQVALGTTVDQLEKMIAQADSGTTFQLQAGTYVFDDRLDIRRGDVTLKGAGEDKTVIQAKVEGTDLIRVQADWQREAYGNIESSEAKLNTTLTAGADKDTSVVHLKSVAGLQAGDFLEISQTTNLYRDDAHDGFLGTLVEVKAVDAATGTVTLEHQVGFQANAGATVRAVELLHNVVLGDFTIDYGTPKNAVDPFRYENNNPQYVGGEAGMGSVGNRAIFFNSVTDSDILNVTIKNAGSNGVFVREAVEVNINGLTVDGVQNLGDGGNGYGLELGRTYFSNFDNLTFTGLVRHAVTYAKDGSSAFNNVHVLSSTANVDFHGGPDYSNIYYVEEMNLPMYKDDYAHPAVEYRDENNSSENIAIVDKVVAPEAVKISKYVPGYTATNYTGSDASFAINDYSGARDDIIFGGVKGSNVSLGGGNDTFVSSVGADTIATGSGKDMIIFGAGNGHDVIMDFDGRYDVIALDHVSGFSAASDVFSHLSQTSAGAQIDLGGGNTILLMGVDMKTLAQDDFLIM